MPITPTQRSEFDRRGILRLPGLLSAGCVRRARDYVQQRLAPIGLWKNDGWHLDAIPRPQWPKTGLKPGEVIGNKHPDIEALLDEPSLLAAVNTLLGGCAPDRTLFPRPQLLFTLPNADTWTVPTGWHADFPRLASGRRPGLQLFACLDTVEPRGGGTLVVAGSHLLLNEGRVIKTKEITRLLRREAFFQALFSDGPERPHLNHPGKTGDVTLELVELTGAPGDVYLMDLRVLHAATPNASAHPRIMATHRFMCEDTGLELSKAFGWRPATP